MRRLGALSRDPDADAPPDGAPQGAKPQTGPRGRVHGLRWRALGGGMGPPDAAARGAELLQRRFAAELAARRQLWLTTLDLDGEPAAAWYGFTWGDSVYFYQGGRDPRWDRESVGLVLMGTMIRRAIERGYRRFDFL